MANLIDVAREFGTDEQCLAYLEAARWPSGLACLKCGSVKVSKTVSTLKARRDSKRTGIKKGDEIGKRYLYDCLEPECGHQFTATTGTIFHDSHLSLSKWFMAVALFCNAKKSLSALQLQRDLGVGSYRTAWYLAHRIRKAMEDQSTSPFVGMVEMDETFIGGKFDKRRKRARFEKQPVIGFIERNSGGPRPSQVRAFPIRKSNGRIVLQATRANVSIDAHLYTDHSLTYTALDKSYARYQVNHIAGEYVRNFIHTNGIENFWSLFKRGIVGSFHSVSIKHLERYLSEFTFRFNNRDAANLFSLTVRRMLAAIALPYRQLVSESE